MMLTSEGSSDCGEYNYISGEMFEQQRAGQKIGCQKSIFKVEVYLLQARFIEVVYLKILGQ